METEQQLLNKLQQLKEDKAKTEEKERKIKNYEKFKNRSEDWVIGRAHADVAFNDNGWHHPKGFQVKSNVSVDGNCGHTYVPTADVTNATGQYFHKVWEHGQRIRFEKELNKVAYREITRIMSDPVCVLEIMGLQLGSYAYKDYYPEDKIDEIKKEVKKEQYKVLSKYSLSKLKKLPRLSHGEQILRDYLKSNGVERK